MVSQPETRNTIKHVKPTGKDLQQTMKVLKLLCLMKNDLIFFFLCLITRSCKHLWYVSLNDVLTANGSEVKMVDEEQKVLRKGEVALARDTRIFHKSFQTKKGNFPVKTDDLISSSKRSRRHGPNPYNAETLADVQGCVGNSQIIQKRPWKPSAFWWGRPAGRRFRPHNLLLHAGFVWSDPRTFTVWPRTSWRFLMRFWGLPLGDDGILSLSLCFLINYLLHSKGSLSHSLRGK